MFKFGKTSEKVLSNPLLHPAMISIARRALTKTKFDFGFGATSGVRNKHEQFALYSSGVSKCDGTKILSRHQPEANESGQCEALDFYAYDENGRPVDGTSLKGLMIMHHILACFFQASLEIGVPIESGLFFEGYGEFGDLGHVNLR